jgi:long-chain acyl-CoA synthetase
MRARVVAVPVDLASRSAFIESIAKETGAAAIIADVGSQPVAWLTAIDLMALPFDAEGPELEDRPEAEDLAEIVFTSGTTGTPKGVMLTHHNIIANVQAVNQVIPAARGWRFLSLLPLSHMLEQTTGLFVALHQGAMIVYPVARSPSLIMSALRRYRIVGMIAVPAVLIEILKRIEREVQKKGKARRWRLAHRLAAHLPGRARRLLFRSVHRQLGGALQLFVCGGASLPSEAAGAWRRMGVKVIEGYGATECAPVIATNRFTEQGFGTVGRALPGVEVRISEVGEIQVKGPNVTPGYWNDEAATGAAFTQDGWYRTGDVGSIDERGRIRLEGRLRDLIVLPSGLNVFPEDLESVLLEQGEIRDAVVLGTEHGPDDVRLTALVVLEPSGGGPDADPRRAEKAVQAANALLAPHQRIRSVRVWDRAFPKTAVGKVKRHQVRALLESQPAASPIVQPETGEAGPAANVLDILAQISGLEASRIALDSRLDLDLGLDSLRHVELALMLEERFGVTIDDGELAELQSVSELLERIELPEAIVPPPAFPDWPLGRAAGIARAVLQRAIVFSVHRVLARPFRIKGLEHVEGREPPLLFVANHTSHLDTLSIIRALSAGARRRLVVAGAADYFYRSRLMGFTLSLLLNTFPFSRRGSVRSSLERCGELADAGWSILIYPEGTRSVSGALMPFKTGTGLLATKLGVAVVPVAVSGAYEILPKGRLLPHPGPITVRFGAPIRLPAEMNAEDASGRLHDGVKKLLAAEANATNTGSNDLQSRSAQS